MLTAGGGGPAITFAKRENNSIEIAHFNWHFVKSAFAQYEG
jgi:hypothetical protein